jgi:peptidoglycan/LPS O-acetylase OafA/YrhL
MRLQSLLKHNLPAVAEMLITATGKTPPFDAGKYMVCKSIEAQTDYQVKTKHFIVTITNWAIIPGLPGEVGICLPAECENGDIAAMLPLIAAKVPQLANLSIASGGYESSSWPPAAGKVPWSNPFNNDDDRLSIGNGTIPAIVLFSILLAVVIFATAFGSYTSSQNESARTDALMEAGARQDQENNRVRYDLLVRTKYPRGLGWCEAFSLNGPNGTWTTLWQDQPRRPTDCLNGMRVISMIFIVMGHTCSEAMNVAGYINKEGIPKTPLSYNSYSTELYAYIFVAGQCAVDTFLLISGFLLSFIGKNRPVPIIMGTILRYCRLLPLFGSAMLIYVCIFPFVSFGPFSPRFQQDVFSKCSQDWWAELFFINAWVPWYPRDGGCMGWSWYLGIDMSFAIVGMVLLNMWKRNKMLGWSATAVLTGVSIGVSIQQAVYWNLGYNVTDAATFGNYSHYIYTRAYLRFPCFAVGLVAPWVMDAWERRGLTRGTQPTSAAAKIGVYVACLLAWIIIILCIFYPWTNSDGAGFNGKKCENFQCWGKGFSVFWIVFSRPIWCLAWLTLAIACYFDYLPIFNAMCSAPFWNPLGNLTYGCYLMHPPIIKLLAANVADYYSWSPQDCLSRTSLNAFLAYGFAVVLWCLVEKPFATMTGWLVPKKKNKDRPINKPVADGNGAVEGTRIAG